jgi:glycosyltransferase involved in cell wall biosynthesis
MSTPISIIIPAFNQLEYCRQCITSIRLATTRPYKLILVDNGSTDGVSEYFDSIKGATVVHAKENVGFAAGVNLGLAHCEGHSLLLNSDTLVPNGWLERLEATLLQSDDIGMVGPRSNCVSGSQLIDDLQFNEMDKINAYADARAKEHGGELRDVARLVGFCLLIRDKVVQEVGLLDEAYGTGNFEDDDYCLRVMRAGYRLCVAEAIAAAPSYDLNYNDLGAVLWQVGEKARAYAEFQHALELNPNSADARENLLDAAKVLGKTDAAQRSVSWRGCRDGGSCIMVCYKQRGMAAGRTRRWTLKFVSIVLRTKKRGCACTRSS